MTYRERALEMLISRRGLSAAEHDWRTRAAWQYLQQHMRKPTLFWTDTPPRTTIGETQ